MCCCPPFPRTTPLKKYHCPSLILSLFVLLLMIDLRFWGIKCISVVAIRKCTWDCMNQSRSYSIDGNENVISFNCINRYARDPPCHENDRCEMCTASSARLKSHLLFFLLLLSSCWRCEMLVVSSSTILDWMSSHQGQLLLSLMTLSPLSSVLVVAGYRGKLWRFSILTCRTIILINNIYDGPLLQVLLLSGSSREISRKSQKYTAGGYYTKGSDNHRTLLRSIINEATNFFWLAKAPSMVAAAGSGI